MIGFIADVLWNVKPYNGDKKRVPRASPSSPSRERSVPPDLWTN